MGNGRVANTLGLSSSRGREEFVKPGRMALVTPKVKKHWAGGRLLTTRFVCPAAPRCNHAQRGGSVKFVLKYKSNTPFALVAGAQTVKTAVLLVSAIFSHKSFVSKIWARKAGQKAAKPAKAKTKPET